MIEIIALFITVLIASVFGLKGLVAVLFVLVGYEVHHKMIYKKWREGVKHSWE